MKISKLLMMGTVAALSLSSCMNEDFPSANSRKGSMSLSVDYLKPTITRAGVETSDFYVAIYEAEDNDWYCTYEKASLIPNKITMPIGAYYVKAHTPGTLQKIMESPYYAGVDEFEILENVITKSTVVCRMANGSFTVKFSSDFTQAFSDWTISLTDGSESAIIYTSQDGTNVPTMYMQFAEAVSALTVNFIGTTVDGNRISTTNKLTKKQASEQYDSDTEYFSGGDAIGLNLRPVESTDGNISSITINANISFEESEESFDMEVEDVIPDTPEEEQPEQPGDGGEASNAITLQLPQNMVVSATTNPSLGDTYISATNGLKSIMVKVSSTSDEMLSSLADLNTEHGVDFVSGAEVVGNQQVVSLFEALNKPLSVPTEGDTEYTFPIGNFFTLLSFLSGEHTFDLVVTDMQGNKKSGSLTLTVE
ncbi:MAG: DUF4493 domain-containing protein [Bacteroidaceae bacterium]|nr:DUF4493 domain-containing protein [Bacteroidaceae bacterium]